MKSYQSELLMIASRLLSYPSEEDKRDIIECVTEMDTTDDVKNTIQEAVDAIYSVPLKDRNELYVATFDLKTSLGLYLSAHEFGDSPKRGAALIKLQKMVNTSGYERADGELADYIPMLFEFLAVMEDSPNKERLIKRLACATQLILNELPEANPYHPIVRALMQFVFDPPTKKELQKLDMEREEADLEELPYPMLYN